MTATFTKTPAAAGSNTTTAGGTMYRKGVRCNPSNPRRGPGKWGLSDQPLPHRVEIGEGVTAAAVAPVPEAGQEEVLVEEAAEEDGDESDSGKALHPHRLEKLVRERITT